MHKTPNIWMSDLSELPRFGVKGREAAAWLQTQRIALPTSANSWLLDQTRLVLRLGNSEFLIEAQQEDRSAELLNTAIKQRPAGIYPVARADAAFMLAGDGVSDLMAEICMLDLRAQTHSSANTQTLYMTQVAGISATLIQQDLNGQMAVRLWCDGTYHAYMHETLSSIASELNALP